MVTHRGENRNSHITGRSVHNQRIERLWRDVYVHVLDPFHCLFQDLEMEGFLNPDDEVHLFALHWAFHPHLQRHLVMFQDAWNNHKLRTTGSQSPLQLWLQFQDLVDPVEVEEDYGIDWEGPYSSNIDSVPVPEVCLGRELSAQQLARLTPPSASFADALDVYIDTVQRVNQIT
ncbi:hypothetical protein SKAU_G00060430 [Synaphobranchus kaupii]|uniref:Integrase core domain-containing protein n=1 Tax=Synaphobranchus kaupii TaxID=118154 RepID=A0A9Q1G5M6_SYNKA|nr:hypothetical protein SKAU_G00060430 [Synaphobranchus kaupii]